MKLGSLLTNVSAMLFEVIIEDGYYFLHSSKKKRCI